MHRHLIEQIFYYTSNRNKPTDCWVSIAQDYSLIFQMLKILKICVM